MAPSESFRFGNQPIGPVTEAEQHSAGGVVYKREGHRLKICLVSKKNGRIWALPKGRLDPGETTEQTAYREILEETGHQSNVGAKIDEIHYYFFLNENQTYYHKTVTFYVMRVTTENAQQRDQEADEVAWFDFPEALRKLSYLNEKKILKKAQRMV
ncbi:NUDIX hydrolase [bacterium]|nr:NUDIX hydrolase [bacterium]